MEAIKDQFIYRAVNQTDLEESEQQKETNGFGIKSKKPLKEEAIRYVVVAVGPGTWDSRNQKYIPLSVQVGDIIAFPSFPNAVSRDAVKERPVFDGLHYQCRPESDQHYPEFVIIERAAGVKEPM